MEAKKLFDDMMAEMWETLQKKTVGPVSRFVNPTLVEQVNGGNDAYIRYMKRTLEPLAEKLYTMVLTAEAKAKMETVKDTREFDSEVSRGIGVKTHSAPLSDIPDDSTT